MSRGVSIRLSTVTLTITDQSVRAMRWVLRDDQSTPDILVLKLIAAAEEMYEAHRFPPADAEATE